MLLNKFISSVEAVCTGLGKLSAGLCLLLLILTAEQVIARYWFKSSSLALQELEWHFFGASFALSSAWALQRDQHVRVDLFYHRWSLRQKALCNMLGHLFFLFPMCYVLIDYGWTEVLLCQSYSSYVPLNHFSASHIDPQAVYYELCSKLEIFIRQWLIFGEGSPDPGGLPARWLPKALIPLCGLTLALQGLALWIKDFKTVFINSGVTTLEQNAPALPPPTEASSHG